MSILSIWKSRLIIAAITATTALPATRCLAEDGIDTRSKLTVNATADTKVAPDSVTLRFAIESREEEVTDAARKTSEQVTRVVQFLKDRGIEARDIRTESIVLSPIYPSGQKGQYAKQGYSNQASQGFGDLFSDEPQIQATQTEAPQPTVRDQLQQNQPIGYSASRQLTIMVRDIKQFEAIYTGILERGVNSIAGIQWMNSDQIQHRRAARMKAVAAAYEKASDMAGALDAKVKRVLSVQESHRGSDPFGNSMQLFGSESEGGSIEAGMMTISASVQVVFELSDTEFDN
ncbi:MULTISPECIES: SIMPL domain-containing protein [Rhodopirellula]|uniref:SIMPL domain-containing protein n=1 Tax=Rhodopirellula TaxID=265488 RepID=UPI00257BAB77|nr:SIMPL domain-containing protein [Rhodopirellula sp. UBA1907]|tara:strand:- start:1975 stop:2841 length:867 start_codon:yes stop_codon:yes gene_type:complete